jgi:hypothetical protein
MTADVHQDTDGIYDKLQKLSEANSVPQKVFLFAYGLESTDPGKFGEINAVISQAKNSFPNLNLHDHVRIWIDDDIANSVYGVKNEESFAKLAPKMATDIVIAAARQAVEAGKRAPNEDILMMVRDITDPVSRSALTQDMITVFESNPDKDTFSADIHWGHYDDLPGLEFVGNFIATLNSMMAIDGHSSLVGETTFVRLSSAAAAEDGTLLTEHDHGQSYDRIIGERIAIARNPSVGGIASGTHKTHGQVLAANGTVDEESVRGLYNAGRSILDVLEGVDISELEPSTSNEKSPSEDEINDIRKKINQQITMALNTLRPTERAKTLAFTTMLDPEEYNLTNDAGNYEFSLTDDGLRWILFKR